MSKALLNRSELKLQTRRKLIESALRLSAQHGFASLSLREITKDVGITPNAFYRHFRDLEELGLVLVDEIGVVLRQLLREARKREEFSIREDSIRASIDLFIKYILDNSNLFRVFLGERQGSSTAFRKSLYAAIDLFVKELTEDLEKGSIFSNRPIKDASLAAEAIVAVVFTIGSQALDLPKSHRSQIVDRLVKHVTIILKGTLSTADLK